MASKPKKRQVPKVRSATQEQPKSHKHDKSVEELIRSNGDMVESLFSSKPWAEIAFPLLEEMIAGVSGRFTNGRYHHGSLTRDLSLNTGLYQKALMDFYNHLKDFIDSRDNLSKAKKEAVAESKAPIYNPFLEDGNDSEN